MAVHGEARRRRTEAAVAALLPHALLCPAVVLERVLKQALVAQGEQVSVLGQGAEFVVSASAKQAPAAASGLRLMCTAAMSFSPAVTSHPRS